MPPSLILASRSPRRSALLACLGLEFEILPADIDETARSGEAAEAYVRRMALDKALAVRVNHADRPILGADTAVIVDQRILGKPSDEADFLAMGRLLRGRGHRVMTALALVHGPHRFIRLSISEVFMADFPESQWRAYWQSGEPADKAGGYAIQGLGAVFVERMAGSCGGVIGLPLRETAQLLAEIGLDVLS